MLNVQLQEEETAKDEKEPVATVESQMIQQPLKGSLIGTKQGDS